ncbi:MAG: RagB/SusD family nutrient uptake outer membrane protein [Muribaculaceae bacterium]|nr:RagB/SusD family nutrient uptake outer membrane protein [Muribaculaceae bacterium]
MKNLNKIFLALGLVAALGMSSCTGDLEFAPEDPTVTTNSEFSKDPQGYMNRVLAECYLSFATTGTGGASGSANVEGFDGGMGTFQRAIYNLNEIPTDESCWLPTNDSHMNATVQYCVFPANNPAIYGTYSRLFINASICNEFIRTVKNGKFGLPENLQATGEEYIRQARILRALSYYYLIDLFGNVPYADESVATGSIPAQNTRAEAYEKVVADLEAVVTEYGDNYDVVYGYVGKEAAMALLTKFYLNAEVFAGVKAYDKCWNMCQQIITRHTGAGFNNSGLVPHYSTLFGANNDTYGPGKAKGLQEILWSIPYDIANLTAFAGSSFMINAHVTSSPAGSPWTIDKADYNTGSGWKCTLARRQFSEKFEWNTDGTSNDTRVKWWGTAADGFKIENTGLAQADYGNGFVAVKYTNWNYLEDGSIDKNNVPATADFCDADYAVIRLAEIYLNAAEAQLRGGGGDAATATQYINFIRERAGVAPWTTFELSLNNVLDERARELYQENCRRTDLVRYGLFTGSGYIWNWKGGVQNGTAIDSHLNLYPIPETVIALAGYQQNPGY